MPDNSDTVKQVHTHTPGPLAISKIGNNYDQYSIYDESDNGRTICNTVEGKANARLFAAAPDLLRTLKTLVQWMDDSGLSATKAGGHAPFTYESTEYSVVRDARAAIVEAERE